MPKLYDKLKTASTEEELKNLFAKFFKLKLDTKNRIDLYTPQILFEFKYDKNLNNTQTLAQCIAQTLYYIRKLKYGKELRAPSGKICVVAKFCAVIAKTEDFKDFYLKSKTKNYDFDLAPSSPCKKLVGDLANFKTLKNLHVYDFTVEEDEKNFIDTVKTSLTSQISLFEEKKEINENNFYPIFEYWQKLFGEAVENGRKASEYFITDIEEGKTVILEDSLLFRMQSGDLVEKFVNLEEYRHFWSVYEKIYNPREMIAIRQKMDRMTEISMRRFTGEFFTPIGFAEKAIEYLARTVGAEWYKTGKFRLWDMAAGTGNLEFALPYEALKYCYISTLLEDDADYCKKIFPDATVFQYDYLNDDAEFFKNEMQLEGLGIKRKMPKKLLEDLKNPEIKWIIFINPPYAMATNFSFVRDRKNKHGVSSTQIQNLMKADNLGEASRDLCVQFLYRIVREFQERQVTIGIFSKLGYVTAEYEKTFRNEYFNAKFERGFTLSSKNFDGCKGKFPIGFLVWNLDGKNKLDNQDIALDVYNSEIEKYAVKNFRYYDNSQYLNKWFKRPPCKKIFPPVSGGINISYSKKDPRNRVAEDFLASFFCSSNDFASQNATALFSGPYVSHGGLSIVPEIFEKCMITHAVRRIPKADWLNNRDQFMQPTKKLTREFITDCVLWSLFSPSNQTVSLRNVEYEGEIYRMKNNLFPFLLSEIQNWKISDANIRAQIAMAKQDRFAALWISEHKAEFSTEGKKLLAAGEKVYKEFYKRLKELDRKKWKIEDWDAGWYQVRMSLGDIGEVKERLLELSQKIEPLIYELGFLRDEVLYYG